MHRLGIDIGSKTIKLVLLDEGGTVVHDLYTRHRSKVRESLADALHDLVWRRGDFLVEAAVTGSAGIAIAEVLDVPFVQEVVALRQAVSALIPEADVIVEMGGEDTKLVYLSGVPEQRMNTMCAGGTGGFIDRMAGLMGKRSRDMHGLAMGAITTYPIASRCAVFAQSDVRPLLNAGARKEDIAASVLEAVCTQAIAGLSCGRPIEGTVVLLGGPFRFIPALRNAFCRVCGIPKKQTISPDDAHLFVARGAALGPERSGAVLLSELEGLVRAADLFDRDGIKRLPPLFSSAQEYDLFKQRHEGARLPRTELHCCCGDDLFLGIDAGSTTIKMALIDADGALCSCEYRRNRGDVVTALADMLRGVHSRLQGNYARGKVLRRCCVVGYGEELCKAAFGIDMGEVETVAHLRAALELDPQTDFLMDIGGQDIKCFYVEDGVITDIVLNEACSSGCGSLFESVARGMRRSKEGLAAEALYAPSPVDLGTRCSVFMDSRVKHAQKEGISQADIGAGVVWATARNALFKVVKQPDFSKVGSHVTVQGGAFANDALLRAFELETGVEAKRSDKPELMGAWGAALLARDEWLAMCAENPATAETDSTVLGPDKLKRLHTRRSTLRCEQCTNACKLSLSRFLDEMGEDVGRSFVTGNRCEKGALALGDASVSRRPPNMLAFKNALIEACDHGEQPSGVTVGIPRVLSLYESYPFWRAFFNALGCRVLPSSQSSEEVFRKGMGLIPAEGACYPSKLLFGHAADLAARGAEALFVPAMGLGFAREGLLGLPLEPAQRDCLLIERMPYMLADNAASSPLAQVPLIAPDLVGMPSLEAAAPALAEALAEAGIPHSARDVVSALQQAQNAYRAFFERLAEQHSLILGRIEAGEFPGALVCGHPYHADPGVSHRIDRLLGELGYAVLEQPDYDFAARPAVEHYPYETARDLFHAAGMAAADCQLILLRSFGCGIDAVAIDRVRDGLRAQGRIFAELKLDQIVDLASVRIRLRSLAYAAKAKGQ